MKNLLPVLLISIAWTGISYSQQGQLIVKSGDKGLHLDHTVVAKEGFFSIGRSYNVHPKHLASYNDLDINKGLNIGQTIHIPLTDTNFSQQAGKGIPVYYRVGDKEGLMKVSNANNGVKLQSLRDWNKLPNDNIKAGSRLIVGFLVPGEAVAVSNPSKEEIKKVSEEKPVAKTEPVVEKPVVKKEDAPDKQIIKEEIKKTDTPEQKPVVKEEPKRTQPVPVKQQVTASMSGQGYFKAHFDQQVKQQPVSKTETVTSGIFRTSYGLPDAKYYMLTDGVVPGTIIRIINPENNRTIYAKVLGEMSGIRQNKGLDIRISEAAAITLGITDMEKFILKMNY
ncbi:MAG: LysM peptidoglycan-binding domain-containing protein [Chitinophagaceae bacterium]|nr:LysM peptidoglycan-binding domain-containing protein [Chitinophagaceae bacterium]